MLLKNGKSKENWSTLIWGLSNPRTNKLLRDRSKVSNSLCCVVGGYPLLAYSVDAVRASQYGTQIVILADSKDERQDELFASLAPGCAVVEIEEAEPGLADMITSGVPTLIVNPLHPFLHQDQLDDFGKRIPARSDIAIGIVPLHGYNKRYQSDDLLTYNLGDEKVLFAGIVAIFTKPPADILSKLTEILNQDRGTSSSKNIGRLFLGSSRSTVEYNLLEWRNNAFDEFGVTIDFVEIIDPLCGFHIRTPKHMDFAARLFAMRR